MTNAKGEFGVRLGLACALCAALAPSGLVPGAGHSGQAMAATRGEVDDRAQTCAKIAELVEPTGQFMANTDQIIAATVASQYVQNPQLAALDARYPGLHQAEIAALGPVVHRFAERVVILLHDDLAKFYAANLTPAEARAYLRFYSTPEMQAFARSARQGENISALAKDAAQSSDHKLTTGELSGATVDSGKRAAARATMQQRMVLGMFVASPLGKK